MNWLHRWLHIWKKGQLKIWGELLHELRRLWRRGTNGGKAPISEKQLNEHSNLHKTANFHFMQRWLSTKCKGKSKNPCSPSTGTRTAPTKMCKHDFDALVSVVSESNRTLTKRRLRHQERAPRWHVWAWFRGFGICRFRKQDVEILPWHLTNPDVPGNSLWIAP